MGRVFREVEGIIGIVIGLVSQQYWIAEVGFALLSSAGVFAPRPPRQKSALTPQDVSYSGTLEPRRLVYGRLRITEALPPYV